jgi:hypothetical protein
MNKLALALAALAYAAPAAAVCTYQGSPPQFVYCIYDEVQMLQATAPVGMGMVNFSGTIMSATPNIDSVTWDATLGRYVVSFSDQNYFIWDYVTNVTLATSGCAVGVTTRTDSLGGDLLVYFRDAGGLARQCDFQFVSFKP